jgi:hypothetical protein
MTGAGVVFLAGATVTDASRASAGACACETEIAQQQKSVAARGKRMLLKFITTIFNCCLAPYYPMKYGYLIIGGKPFLTG